MFYIGPSNLNGFSRPTSQVWWRAVLQLVVGQVLSKRRHTAAEISNKSLPIVCPRDEDGVEGCQLHMAASMMRFFISTWMHLTDSHPDLVTYKSRIHKGFSDTHIFLSISTFSRKTWTVCKQSVIWWWHFKEKLTYHLHSRPLDFSTINDTHTWMDFFKRK